MKQIVLKIISLALSAAFLLSSCATKTDVQDLEASQPHLITGAYQVTNDFVLTRYYVENAVALVDMHGFVTRDK